MAIIVCRLCFEDARLFTSVDDVTYLACDHCGLRFMHADHLPDPVAEKGHYDNHENDVRNEDYRQFLSRLAQPLMDALPDGASVLDFGAGPGPALAAMMQDAGYEMTIYDPFYNDDHSSLERSYDAVTATEVIEHFHDPRLMFDLLDRLVRPGGWLAVMTMLQHDDDAFAAWHYRRDPTHVAFYREETFTWIAAHYGYVLSRPHRNVAIFHKAFSFD
jgi:SAM-dependent methyltransferase